MVPKRGELHRGPIPGKPNAKVGRVTDNAHQERQHRAAPRCNTAGGHWELSGNLVRDALSRFKALDLSEGLAAWRNTVKNLVHRTRVENS